MQAAPCQAGQAPDRFRRHLGPILFLTSLFFVNFLSRIILAPLLPTIEKDLVIGHGEAGSLFLLISVGYFISLIASGHVSARLLHRRTIVLSALSLGGALVWVALSQDIWGIRCALIVVGMAAGLYLPSGIATLTTIVHPRHWGKALSIHEIAPNVSFVAAPLLAEAMLGWVSWRSALCILGGLTLVLGLAFARFGKGGDFPGKSPSFGALNTLLRLPAFWITMSLFMLGISATMGIFTMLPLFLINVHDMTRSAANELIGLSRVLAIGMSFISGWTSDRLGPKRTLIIVFLLNGTATILLGAVSTDWLRVLIFLQPLVAVCVFPPAFVVLSAIGPPNMRNVAVSLTVPAAFILGGGVMPMLIGMLGDRGHFAAGIIMVGAMLLVGAVLVGFLSSTPSEAVETALEACPSATPEDA